MSYAGLRGRTGNRIRHFLYSMNPSSDYWAHIEFKDEGGIITYDYLTTPQGYIYDGPVVATFTWIEDTDIPLLEFKPGWAEKYKERYFRIMVEIIASEARQGIPLWSEYYHQQEEAKKKEEEMKKSHETIMRGIGD